MHVLDVKNSNFLTEILDHILGYTQNFRDFLQHGGVQLFFLLQLRDGLLAQAQAGRQRLLLDAQHLADAFDAPAVVRRIGKGFHRPKLPKIPKW